jgi:hypothetical protein
VGRLAQIVHLVLQRISDRLRCAWNANAFVSHLGVNLQGRVRFYEVNRGMFGSEPGLITIGNNV